jgi:hypothetical protein
MAYWARLIRNPGGWIGILPDIGADAIPLTVLADLSDKDGRVSVWLVDDLDASLRRVAAALQPKDRAPAKAIFRVIECARLTALGIDEPTRTEGKSLDLALNTENHYILELTTNGHAIKVARAFLELDEVPFIQADIVDEMLQLIRDERISIKEFGQELCRWLVREGKLCPIPVGASASAQGETTT